jgi:TatD DNase family protein
MDDFKNPNQLKKDSKQIGIDSIICVGGDINSSIKAIELSQNFPDFYYSGIGIHPENFLKENFQKFEKFINENVSKCVAIGEVGLDYAYDFARPKEIREKMRELYTSILEIAVNYRLPASVHSRSAYKDSVSIAAELGVEAVFHWYDGPIHVLHNLLDYGFYISATPSILYSKGAQRVMLEAPLDRILVETDSPVYLRNLARKSTPLDLLMVVKALADLKDADLKEVSRVTTRNTENLFGI